jgi:hypothetical protein
MQINYTVAPTVTTQSVSNIGHILATGNGNVTSDGGDPVTERGFCWNTTGTPTVADSKVIVAGTTGVYSGIMTGLSVGTLYYVRPYAINGTGTGYGSEVTFRTIVGTPKRQRRVKFFIDSI